MNIFAQQMSTKDQEKQQGKLSEETRTFHNGPLLDYVRPLVEGVYKQEHATVCQERSAVERL